MRIGVINIFFILSTLFPPLNSTFGKLKKGFLTAEKIKQKNVEKNQSLPNKNVQNFGEVSKNAEETPTAQIERNAKEKGKNKQDFDKNFKKDDQIFQNQPRLSAENIGESSKNEVKTQNSLAKNAKKNEDIVEDFGEILAENNGNSLKEIKIRVLNRIDNLPRHSFVVVGNYEYDFLEGGARRRKFQFDLDHKINKSNPRKAQPFKEKLFVKQNKADEVFFEMGRRFWVSENFSDNMANCLDFVFNFVCALFDGKCPNKKIWPNCFVGLDADKSAEYTMLERHPASVFKRELIPLPDLIAGNTSLKNETLTLGDQDISITLENFNNEYMFQQIGQRWSIANLESICFFVADGGQCELKDYRVKFRIKSAPNALNFANIVLFHLTGHLRKSKNIGANDALIRTIYVQTIPEKVWAEDKNIRFDVVLKAYSCKICWWAEQKQQRMVAIALNLLILDETTKNLLRLKNVCHSHRISSYGPINLDKLTDHIVEMEINELNGCVPVDLD